MRPTIRPFKIEFKNRSSKSTPMRSPSGDGADKDRVEPSFLDVGIFRSGHSSHANGYGDARKAADALFARRVPTASAPEATSVSDVPMSRVLPNLIENGVALAVRSVEVDQRPDRGRVARKAKAASPALSKIPTIQQESGVLQDSVEQAAMQIAPEAPIVAAPDRERRSIHKRRLLDAELKAGEKWKRRLCRAAR